MSRERFVDLPGSAAARGFIGIARSQDQVAMYALANNLFSVVSRLVKSRYHMIQTLDAIPEVSGSSPLYDCIVLACAEEFRQRPLERNALIVITDGADNQLSGTTLPSAVPFDRLRRAASGMDAIIYPVLLEPRPGVFDPMSKLDPQRWARLAVEQMEQLARATGGRCFKARAITAMASVYPLVAAELRSVYSLGYSPKNQHFDGTWRRIEVRVNRRGAHVRTRPGYYAR